MIKPTVGRVVWFWPEGAPLDPRQQPLSASIAHVHSDECINIGYLNEFGEHDNKTSVPLWQGEGGQPKTAHCQWMPYQVGQAKAAGK